MFNSLGQCFGGTSLIIMVGVAIDTIQQINSYLLNKHYDGFNEEWKIKSSSLILWQNNQQ
jgi:preprotein translocase subunit SecY